MYSTLQACATRGVASRPSSTPQSSRGPRDRVEHRRGWGGRGWRRDARSATEGRQGGPMHQLGAHLTLPLQANLDQGVGRLAQSNLPARALRRARHSSSCSSLSALAESTSKVSSDALQALPWHPSGLHGAPHGSRIPPTPSRPPTPPRDRQPCCLKLRKIAIGGQAAAALSNQAHFTTEYEVDDLYRRMTTGDSC